MFDDDRYWVVDVTHAKADPHDLLMEISVTNAGPETSTLHVLPHLWFRNTWSWDVGAERPALQAAGADRVAVDHPRFGELTWELDAGPGRRGARAAVLRQRHQPARALRGAGLARRTRRTASTTTSSHGAATVNPDARGTKAAAGTASRSRRARPQVVRVRLRAALVDARVRHGVRRRCSSSGAERPTSSTPS